MMSIMSMYVKALHCTNSLGSINFSSDIELSIIDKEQTQEKDTLQIINY